MARKSKSHPKSNVRSFHHVTSAAENAILDSLLVRQIRPHSPPAVNYEAIQLETINRLQQFDAAAVEEEVVKRLREVADEIVGANRKSRRMLCP